MNNSYYNVSHSRDYYKGKSVEFAGEWTSGVRYFNDEYLNSLVVYTEKDTTGNIIHSALLACKKTHIAAYNSSIPDSTNNQPHLIINDDLGTIGIEPNDYWIFVSGSLTGTPGTPGKSTEVVNTYLEAVALANEHNISKIVFVKEEKGIYIITDIGELKKIISTSDLLELAENKVDKELGKGLSTNDFSNTEKAKLKGIEDNAQRNIIEEIDLNGVKIDPIDKTISINTVGSINEQTGDITLRDNSETAWDVNLHIEDHQIQGKVVTPKSVGSETTPVYFNENGEITPINIDDEVTKNSNKLVTSGAIYRSLDLKQNQLIPGDNITIQNNVISAKNEINLDKYAKIKDVEEKLSTKQDTLMPDNGIKIEENRISVTAITESEEQPTTSIWINPEENTEVVLSYNRSQIDALVDSKQNILTAGKGIQIVGSTISSTVDSNPFITVSALPSVGESGKIYLVPAESPENNNVADEWIWNNGSWERLGSASVDLSNCPKLMDLTAIIATETDHITEERFNELKGLLSSPNTIFSFNRGGVYYYSTSVDLSKISDAPSGTNYESIDNIVIYFPKKQDTDGVYGYKVVLSSGFNNASHDFWWSIYLTQNDFSVNTYNGVAAGLVPSNPDRFTKKYLNVNGSWTTVKSSELENDRGFIPESALSNVAKTGEYSDLINKPLVKSSEEPTNEEPLWINPDEDPEEVEVYNRSQVDALLNTKQDTLVPGSGIIIDGNVISSIGGSGGGSGGGSIDLSTYAKKADVETALAGKQNVISDLANIREGAEKGKTALQSFTETDPVYTADKPNLATKAELNTKQNTISDLDIIRNRANKGSTALQPIQSITYAELVALRDSSSLIAGMQYRITDYTCTTTASGTKSAGHVFDIIVTADSESVLNKDARAIQHEGDTYFANCDLNAWKLWYSLDNDTTRFAWADATNGKGVIYRMIDEFNNDVPYDFKNIQFYRKWNASESLWSNISSNNTGIPCYTFSSRGDKTTTSFTDYSLTASNYIYSNIIKKYTGTKQQLLNKNCFFGPNCYCNSFSNNCLHNSFGDNCYNNSFGYGCIDNSFRSTDHQNSFGNNCQNNYFDSKCINNTFGYYCLNNNFRFNCSYNTFGSDCGYNTFGPDCSYNTFGSACSNNSFRAGASKTSPLIGYVRDNHFDDGCSYNIIWSSNTTSSSISLKNINVNRGVVGKYNSYNMINIDILNSEQEINVNQIDGVISISNISDILNKLDKTIEINYVDLVRLRNNAQLIPGQKYRINDYITKTSQENTKSAGHQFDIIVTALDERTLSEEAQAIQNNNDEYFNGSNLSAWKLWYCLDNDTNRFAWAGNVKVGEIKYTSYDSSKCTINPELINSNTFITPFNFESCVWVDGNNDGEAYSDDHIHHDISELIYEWGYFTDENGVNQLCIYKSEARLYAKEGHPDYGDKYLYRGVVNVDGTEYDYWQKWDDWNGNDGGLNINGGDDYVYATTKRIVSNPEAYSETIKTEGIYEPGKGVIYRMIDEWNNDVPYDFKNIMYNGSWGYWAYTFNWINDNSDNTCEDLSVAQYAHTNDESGYSHTYGNIIKPYGQDGGNYGSPLQLNVCAFLNNESNEAGNFYGCFSNIFGNDCFSNTFGNSCSHNIFGDSCSHNTFGNNCSFNSFGNGYSYNILENDYSYNTFGDNCFSNTFGNNCSHNTFGYGCFSNTFGNDYSYNTFGNGYSYNTFGNNCFSNTFGNSCSYNVFGDSCSYNTFGNNCSYNTFASTSSATTKYNYYRQNHFGDGCQFILFKGAETASPSTQVQNYNFAQGLQGTANAYFTIDGVRNRDYETKVAKNSSGELKIYCEADLIA